MSHSPGVTIKQLVKLPKDPADCWTWLGTTDGSGTARKDFCGQQLVARRWQWMQLFGPIPPGLVITTTCGSKSCINPHHLRACTQAEACRGSVQTLLMPDDVTEIRRAKKDKGPNTARVLADRFGVSDTTIRDIWNRNTWAKPRPNFGPRKRSPTSSPALEAAATPAP